MLFINLRNKITRLYYIIRVNKVIISPTELNSAPLPEIMKLYIEGLSKNLYEKFTLCGMMIDIIKNISFVPVHSLRNQDFFIPTNINPIFDEVAQSNILQSVRKALCKTSTFLNDIPVDDLQLKLTIDNQNMFILDNNFNDIQSIMPYM